MNVKLITKALHTLSLLSEEDYDLVLKLRALTEDEREQFRTALELQKPVGKKAATKTRTYKRCVQCDKTKGHAFHKDSSNDGYHVFQSPPSSKSSPKSPRATGIEQQLSKRREQGRAGATPTHCYATIDDNGGEMTCGKPEDDPVHDMTYLSSHPFARDARPATTRSPANGGASSITPNSVDGTDDAGSVAHGASGGS